MSELLRKQKIKAESEDSCQLWLTTAWRLPASKNKTAPCVNTMMEIVSLWVNLLHTKTLCFSWTVVMLLIYWAVCVSAVMGAVSLARKHWTWKIYLVTFRTVAMQCNKIKICLQFITILISSVFIRIFITSLFIRYLFSDRILLFLFWQSINVCQMPR